MDPGVQQAFTEARAETTQMIRRIEERCNAAAVQQQGQVMQHADMLKKINGRKLIVRLVNQIVGMQKINGTQRKLMVWDVSKIVGMLKKINGTHPHRQST
jgi:hypothetical protein